MPKQRNANVHKSLSTVSWGTYITLSVTMDPARPRMKWGYMPPSSRNVACGLWCVESGRVSGEYCARYAMTNGWLQSKSSAVFADRLISMMETSWYSTSDRNLNQGGTAACVIRFQTQWSYLSRLFRQHVAEIEVQNLVESFVSLVK